MKDTPEQVAHDLAALEHLARAALSRWGIAPDAEVALINLSENATYRIDHGGRRWALRVHRDGYNSDQAILSELAWLTALRRDGVVATPVPVPGEDGALIQHVGDDALPHPRRMVLFDWEAGIEPGMDDDLSRPFETLGEIAARMNRHARTWQQPGGFTRMTWDWDAALGPVSRWGRWQDGMGLDGTARAVFADASALVRERLQTYGTGPDRFGLVHADLRLANLLIDRDRVKVIDFDDCGFSWFMYDAATPVSFFEHRPEVPDLIRRWVAGYRRVIDLAQADEDEIPTFLMLRRLLLVAWIGSHAETPLAKEMGVAYTRGTVPLCRDYMERMG